MGYPKIKVMAFFFFGWGGGGGGMLHPYIMNPFESLTFHPSMIFLETFRMHLSVSPFNYWDSMLPVATHDRTAVTRHFSDLVVLTSILFSFSHLLF